MYGARVDVPQQQLYVRMHIIKMIPSQITYPNNFVKRSGNQRIVNSTDLSSVSARKLNSHIISKDEKKSYCISIE